MRLRKVKDASLKLQAYGKSVFLSVESFLKEKNNILKDKEVRIELGCGKGQFITEMARLNPEVEFIAFEKYDSVLLRSLEKYSLNPVPNLHFVLADAASLEQIFSSEEISVIYLNFSDPWPKARNAKRRLTSPIFLNIYRNILKRDGKIIQKTDNRHLFAYSLESYSKEGYVIEHISLDLHKEDWFNVTTEFEDKWSPKGPIYYVEAYLKHE